MALIAPRSDAPSSDREAIKAMRITRAQSHQFSESEDAEIQRLASDGLRPLWPNGPAGHNAAHTCDVSQSTDSWSNALRYLSITARIAWRAASVSGCTSSSTFVRS